MSSALFLVFIFLLGCSPPCHQWELVNIKANCPCITYSKAYLPVCSRFSGIEAELLCAGAEKHLYLNAFSLQFPKCADDEDTTEVIVLINDIEYTFIAQRFEGGQRLLLPEIAQQLIIDALLEGHCIDLSTGHYRATLIPDNFVNVYNKL